MKEKFGKITQVIGPVVDVAFDGGENAIPSIYTALTVTRPDGSDLVLEVDGEHRWIATRHASEKSWFSNFSAYRRTGERPIAECDWSTN